MTEKEKEAIKNLQEVAEKGIDIYEEINVMENEDAIRIVLNLIEKQQKEIEELKKVIKMVEIYKSHGIPEDVEMVIMRRDNFLRNTNNEFISKDEIREILQIEGNSDIETYLKTIVAENNRLEDIEDDRDCNYISKDKIREFIKKELPDDDIMVTCNNYDINGVLIREKLEKLLEE